MILPLFAARSAYAADSFTRAALAPTAAAVLAAAVPTAPLTTPVAAPSGGTAAGRVGLAVPLARGAVCSPGGAPIRVTPPASSLATLA